jgi:hypothetical protein
MRESVTIMVGGVAGFAVFRLALLVMLWRAQSDHSQVAEHLIRVDRRVLDDGRLLGAGDQLPIECGSALARRSTRRDRSPPASPSPACTPMRTINDTARRLLGDVLERWQHVPGNHRATAWGYAMLSDVRSQFGQPDEAARAMRQTVTSSRSRR